jgi:type IV secretory pathway TraG/TraD family ATPase VirD4
MNYSKILTYDNVILIGTSGNMSYILFRVIFPIFGLGFIRQEIIKGTNKVYTCLYEYMHLYMYVYVKTVNSINAIVICISTCIQPYVCIFVYIFIHYLHMQTCIN